MATPSTLFITSLTILIILNAQPPPIGPFNNLKLNPSNPLPPLPPNGSPNLLSPNEPLPTVATLCLIPYCVDPCKPLLAWAQHTGITPYCSGHPKTRCQAQSVCNTQCYARYFDEFTNEEITDCQLIYSYIEWTVDPTSVPTPAPTTINPTSHPITGNPTSNPTINPTHNPTSYPITKSPTSPPTLLPTMQPTENPTSNPTSHPTSNPTRNPTARPTLLRPTNEPTSNPTMEPTANPSSQPTLEPTTNPTVNPTVLNITANALIANSPSTTTPPKSTRAYTTTKAAFATPVQSATTKVPDVVPIATPLKSASTTPCRLPPCVDPCSPYESVLNLIPHQQLACKGYTNAVRCQGHAECAGCYHTFHDIATDEQIIDCQPEFTPIPPPSPTAQPTSIAAPVEVVAAPSPTSQPTTNPIATIAAPVDISAPVEVVAVPSPSSQPTTNPIAAIAPSAQPTLIAAPVEVVVVGFPTLQPTTNPMPALYQNCPLPGTACSDLVRQADRCCDGQNGGNNKCGWEREDNLGNRHGTCCVRARKPGCTQKSDCCANSRTCHNGYCLNEYEIAMGPVLARKIMAPLDVWEDYERDGDIQQVIAMVVWIGMIMLCLCCYGVMVCFRKRKENEFIEADALSDSSDDTMNITDALPIYL